MAGRFRPHRHSLTLVVKGTFRLTPGTPAATDPENQLPLSADRYSVQSLDSSLIYASDFAPFKPRADLVLVGHCHTPDARPKPICPVTFKVGDRSRTLWVFGDRFWKRSMVGLWSSTDPEPFTQMALTYENSFGGQGYANNPVGKGYIQELKQNSPRSGLPNIEDSRKLVSSPHSKIDTAGFGPLAGAWKQRFAHRGTPSHERLTTRQTGFAPDFDWRFFNAAPKPMQTDGYLHGDESLFFEHLHPRHPQYNSRLPGLRIRCFTESEADTASIFREIPMHLDTLWVDMDQESLVLVWRGVADVTSEQHPEVLSVGIVAEDLSQAPKPMEDYRPRQDSKPPAVAAAAEDIPDPEEIDIDPRLQAAFEEMEKALKQSGIDLQALDRAAAARNSLIPGSAGFTAALGLNEAVDAMSPARKKRVMAQQSELFEQMGLDGRAFEAMAAQEAPPEPMDRDQVVERLAHGGSLAGEDLSHLDLSGHDLQGVDLRGAILQGANLNGTNLEAADLTQANLVEANLHAANCRAARLSDTDLTGADLRACDLSGARLEGALLADASLAGADLADSKAQGALLPDADLSDARLLRADLTGADFTGANLAQTVLKNAVLIDARLDGVDGKAVDMTGADLTRVSAAGCGLRNGLFAQVRANESFWEAADLEEADFSAADLQDADFSGADLMAANFNLADLGGARLSEANLTSAQLIQGNLFQANLSRANLTSADLRGANLYGADMTAAVRRRTRLDQANVKMALMEEND